MYSLLLSLSSALQYFDDGLILVMIDVFLEKHGEEIPKTKQTMTTLVDYLAEQLPIGGKLSQVNYWKSGTAKTSFMNFRNSEDIWLTTEAMNLEDFAVLLAERAHRILIVNTVTKYYEADFLLAMDVDTIKYLIAIIIDAEAFDKEVFAIKSI